MIKGALFVILFGILLWMCSWNIFYILEHDSKFELLEKRIQEIESTVGGIQIGKEYE